MPSKILRLNGIVLGKATNREIRWSLNPTV